MPRPTMSDLGVGDRVTFTARSFGPADPLEGTPVTLSGTVFRPVWGSAADESRRNVSIRTDAGRTYVRLACAVTPRVGAP
jgi:hypothetical protein